MIDLKNTYIVNDKGELRDLYLREAKEHGYKTHFMGTDFDVLHIGGDYEVVIHGVSGLACNLYTSDKKQLTLADLKQQIQNKTPEEKEALDRIDTTNAQFESLSVEVNSEPVYIETGIPELGGVCQCRIRNVHSCKEWSKWFECRFQGGFMHKIWVYDCNGMVDHIVAAHNVEFRKEETPEQKAARERIEEAEGIMEHEAEWSSLFNSGLTAASFGEYMYDAGYRKIGKDITE